MEATKQPQTEVVEKLYFTYDQIHKTCISSAKLILKSFKPDIILAIGGGGLIPARIIRCILDIPVYVVSLSTYDKNDNQIETPRIIQWMDFSSFKGKRILIVDEVDDTRKTLSFLTNKLVNEEGLSSRNLGVFVLHNKLKQKHTNLNNINIYYYHAGKELHDKWIVYPWDLDSFN